MKKFPELPLYDSIDANIKIPYLKAEKNVQVWIFI